jgi:hypothetical protein
VTSSTVAAGIVGLFDRTLDARSASVRRVAARFCLSVGGGSLGGGGSVGASERSRAPFGAGPLCRVAVLERWVLGTVSGSVVGKRSLRAILALDRRQKRHMGQIR